MGRILMVLVVIAAAAVLALGYLGFVPGVATAFGSDKPRDLGIRATEADAQSANQKAGISLAALPAGVSPEESLQLSGQKAVNASFSDEELTALVRVHEGKWAYYPVSDCQIKINGDGTVEASGILRMDRAYGYAQATGVPAEVVSVVVDRLKIANTNPPFYVKGTVSVANNKVSGVVQQVEIGRFTLPANWVADNKAAIASFLEDRLDRAEIAAKSVTFANGAMKFEGTVPENVGFSPPGGN